MFYFHRWGKESNLPLALFILLSISVDQLLFGDATESKSTARRQLDPLLDGMTEAELKIVIATAQAILDARAEEEK
ncbi:hypothetical protein QUW63_08605 [Pseudoflavonifractor phocaeensis]|uniref:hypothetical protein n=1 Tax=Pseudoflavonifractor phocaeensis TaxID=1870988 RepID=UPI0025A4ADC2|nr:hypothetical protein [Pseudoflavonifractor phocaeensis]MDM8239166.1 hypothetical protein [Pseudoflavonifractor phocaeensis]